MNVYQLKSLRFSYAIVEEVKDPKIIEEVKELVVEEADLALVEIEENSYYVTKEELTEEELKKVAFVQVDYEKDSIHLVLDIPIEYTDVYIEEELERYRKVLLVRQAEQLNE